MVVIRALYMILENIAFIIGILRSRVRTPRLARAVEGGLHGCACPDGDRKNNVAYRKRKRRI